MNPVLYFIVVVLCVGLVGFVGGEILLPLITWLEGRPSKAERAEQVEADYQEVVRLISQ